MGYDEEGSSLIQARGNFLPSSLVKDALGGDDGAGGAFLEAFGGCGGGVAPGVLVGNLRAPFWAAFEVADPIVVYFPASLPHGE